MRIPALPLLLATPLLFPGAQESAAPDSEPDQEAFELSTLLEHMDEAELGWHAFIDRPDLACGIYRLDAGGEDHQSPHARDEVYYVLEGKARLTAGDEEFELIEGSIAYVAKRIPHRFHHIEEDLVVLVFFASGK